MFGGLEGEDGGDGEGQSERGEEAREGDEGCIVEAKEAAAMGTKMEG